MSDAVEEIVESYRAKVEKLNHLEQEKAKVEADLAEIRDAMAKKPSDLKERFAKAIAGANNMPV